MSYFPPCKDRFDQPWNCRGTMMVSFKHTWQCFPCPCQNLQQGPLALNLLEKKIHLQNFTQDSMCIITWFPITAIYRENGCITRDFWNKGEGGRSLGDGEIKLNGNIMSEKESLWFFFIKSREREKLTKNISTKPYSFETLSANHSQTSIFHISTAIYNTCRNHGIF